MILFILQIKKLAGLGMTGMLVDKKYGGSGADSLSLSVAVEEISRQVTFNLLLLSYKYTLFNDYF